MTHLLTIRASQTIGVIDSGIGGLSILNTLITLAPHHRFIYVADAAHLPYGQKSTEYLIERATRITRYFQKQGIVTIFVACHTLSATALPLLKKLFPTVTYIDMAPATTEKALKTTRNKRIGIMATTATIESHMHKKLLENTDSTVSTFEQACPLFVPLIEQQASPQELKVAIQVYLKPLLMENVDTIILGCTHYPFIQDQLQQEAPGITFISAANSFPEIVFEKDSTINKEKPFVNFVTTASRDYIKHAVEHCFVHSAICAFTCTTQSDL